MQLWYLFLLVLTSLALLPYGSSIAVMSVDFGSEWMKIGIVSPGVPMEIVLNKESKRKTPAVVSFRDETRTFGEDAQTLGIRFPKNSYSYLLDLLGKSVDHPIVKLFQKRFPYYDIVDDPQRGTVLFKHDEDLFYSPEELIGQLLHRAKEFAEQSAQQPIKECVLTVPGYFNQAERKALLQAAELADLKVLQLINDYTAVALNYGIFRSKDFNETTQYVMFYDMGASSTTATIVGFQTVKTKERGYLETHPQLSVIGVGYDRTLGGLEMQLRLRDYLAKKFTDMKKTTNSVYDSPRAMAKLMKEAGRVKQVLSANVDHFAQIEGLLDEQDFRVQVTREDFENECLDLFDRVGAPVEQALKVAGLSVDVLNQVVLVGAGTRVPKVQEKLQKIVKQDLAKNLNTDEAAAMGAVYKAADLSTGFKVKRFITKDGVLFPIQVVFQRDSEGTIKHIKRTLFGLMNPYPQKKIITFNKHTEDFTFHVNYAELDHLPQAEIANIGGLNLTKIDLIGVGDAITKTQDDNIETRGIKAHFALDDSQILKLVNVELVVDKLIAPLEEIAESSLSKLGSTISKLFIGERGSFDKQEDDKPSDDNSEGETKPDVKENENATSHNETDTTKNDTKKEEFPKEIKPQLVTVKEPIKASETILCVDTLNKIQLGESSAKLEKLNKIDKEINRRATSLNNLESFIIDIQNKLIEDEYVEAATEEEAEKIKEAASQASDWLYDEGVDSDADTYDSKLQELKALTRPLYSRVFEHHERPEALSALNSVLNGSKHFLELAHNFTKGVNPDKDVFTEVEIETLKNVITETEAWTEKAIAEQNSLKKSDPVKLTVRTISDKMAVLDREVKYLMNKLKIWKPKKTAKPKGEDVNKTGDEATTSETGSTDETQIEEEPPSDEDEGKREDEHTEL